MTPPRTGPYESEAAARNETADVTSPGKGKDSGRLVEEEQSYAGRMKAAVLGSLETVKSAPRSFEEAAAMLRGERDVKPDFERAAYTVSAVSYISTSICLILLFYFGLCSKSQQGFSCQVVVYCFCFLFKRVRVLGF